MMLFFVIKGNPQCQKVNVNYTNTKIILTLTSTIGLLHDRNMYVCMYVCHGYVDYIVIDQLHILA